MRVSEILVWVSQSPLPPSALLSQLEFGVSYSLHPLSGPRADTLRPGAGAGRARLGETCWSPAWCLPKGFGWPIGT